MAVAADCRIIYSQYLQYKPDLYVNLYLYIIMRTASRAVVFTDQQNHHDL